MGFEEFFLKLLDQAHGEKVRDSTLLGFLSLFTLLRILSFLEGSLGQPFTFPPELKTEAARLLGSGEAELPKLVRKIKEAGSLGQGEMLGMLINFLTALPSAEEKTKQKGETQPKS